MSINLTGKPPSDATVTNSDAPASPHPSTAQRPEAMRVATGGTTVHLLVWGERGMPGVFLLHGAGAHAHWWDSVAPSLATQHRVAAMSLPGNGASEWRDHYSSASFFDDACACVAAADLDAVGKPVFVGHSMGGAHLMHGAIYAPEAMAGLVLIDTSFRSTGSGRSATGHATRRIYATEEEALSRFRLTPPGPARESGLLQYVARHGLMQVVGPTGELGYSWRADPAYWKKFERGIEQGPYTQPLRPRVRTVHLIAELSDVATASLPLDETVVRILLPDCGHHVMLDRPLLLAASLRTLLAVWP